MTADDPLPDSEFQRLARRAPQLVVAWAAVGVLMLGLAARWAVFVAILLLPLYLIAAFVVLALASERASQLGWSVRAALVPLLVPAVALLLWEFKRPVASAVDRVLFAYSFRQHRAAYDRIVADELARPVYDRTPVDREVGGVRYRTEIGTARRIGFPQPGGFLDNWEAVIFDPTREVATARGWERGMNGSYTASAEVIEIFGGALLACKHIDGNYYRCWFT